MGAFFLDARRGWLAVSGDGPGQLSPVGYATGIGFRDDRVGWPGVRYHGQAGAPGRVPIELYRSVDGGRSWQSRPCPPPLRQAPAPPGRPRRRRFSSRGIGSWRVPRW